jgi:predicted Zn-dependent protease
MLFNRLSHWLHVVVVSILVSGCTTTTGPTKSFTPNSIPQVRIPPQASITQTQQVIVQELGRKKGMKLYNSGADFQRVNRLVKRLSSAAGLGSFSFPVIIADAGNKVNAMAVNGNTIVVYKELLRRVPNDTELAAVIGHEMAHIASRHHEDKTAENRAAGVQIGANLLGSLIGRRVGVTEGELVSKIAGTLGQGLFVNSYSREMEYEADHTGMLLMARAGYNPQGAINFWSNANQIFGVSGGADFLSSHPSEGRRLARLQQSLPTAMQYFKH